MTATLVSDIRELKIKINGPRGDGTAGTTEVRFMSPDTSSSTAVVQAQKLINLRRRFLHSDCTIVDAKLSRWSAPNKTLKVISAPLAGQWPPTTRDTLSETSISLAPEMSPPSGVDNTNLTFDTDELFDYSDPEIQALFRLEGDEDIHSSLGFHFIPELFVDALKRVNDPSSPPVWYDSADPPTEPTVVAASGNFFTNMKDYFTYMKMYFGMVTEVNGAQWKFHTISKVFFEKMNTRDMGPGFGQRRGRARVGS